MSRLRTRLRECLNKAIYLHVKTLSKHLLWITFLYKTLMWS